MAGIGSKPSMGCSAFALTVSHGAGAGSENEDAAPQDEAVDVRVAHVGFVVCVPSGEVKNPVGDGPA